MHNQLVEYLLVPMPLLWLLLLALALWRWRSLSRGLFLVATLLFTLLSLPVVGQALLAPLAVAAIPYDESSATEIDAVVVPTGGSFPDGAGRWWPTEGSIVRAVAGRRLQQALGVPLILTGGSPYPNDPPDAVVTAEALALVGPAMHFDTGSRNSAESAAAVSAMLDPEMSGQDGVRSVILVTGSSHIARMAAALRHHGIAVFAAPVAASRRSDQPEGLTIGDFIPSDRGFKASRAAQWEYMGIAWYLLTGQISLADLGV